MLVLAVGYVCVAKDLLLLLLCSVLAAGNAAVGKLLGDPDGEVMTRLWCWWWGDDDGETTGQETGGNARQEPQ